MSKNSQREVSAFNAGKLAKKNKLSLKNNPYTKGLGRQWVAGFFEGPDKKKYKKIPKSNVKLRTQTQKNQDKSKRKKLLAMAY